MAKNGPKQHNKVFYTRRAKNASAEGRSPPQELEVGTRSGPYLVVLTKKRTARNFAVYEERLSTDFSVASEQVTAMLGEADTDGDGQINLTEFTQVQNTVYSVQVQCTVYSIQFAGTVYTVRCSGKFTSA